MSYINKNKNVLFLYFYPKYSNKYIQVFILYIKYIKYIQE